MPVHHAGPADITALVALLNMGYRGENARKGWTHEADLIPGEIRTDAATLASLMKQPHSAFLKYVDKDNQLIGCVFLQNHSGRLYLGMLCVNPEIQSQGIGKLLMNAAIDFAKENGCTSIYMKVISAREELIAWYERQGYKKTGETEPFPDDSEFGIPLEPTVFEILEKSI